MFKNSFMELPSCTSYQEKNASSILLAKPGEQIRPEVTLTHAVRIVEEEFGFKVLTVKKLNSYEDQNFFVQVLPAHVNPFVQTQWCYGYTLKILNNLESQRPEFVVAQNVLLDFLYKKQFVCPHPVTNLNGSLYFVKALPATLKNEGSQGVHKKKHILRLLTFVPGELLSNVSSHVDTLYRVGRHLAKLHEAMKEFHHPAFYHRRTIWSLDCVSYLRNYLHAVHDCTHQVLVKEVIQHFENLMEVNYQHLPQGLIHGDYNEQNILVEAASVCCHNASHRVCGVLDFADVQWSCYIFDVAIGTMYMMIDWKEANPILASGYFIAGYVSLHPLNEQELEVLKVCVAARFCQSLVMGAYSHLLDPKNDYILTTQNKGWNLISEFWSLSQASLHSLWKNVINCKN